MLNYMIPLSGYNKKNGKWTMISDDIYTIGLSSNAIVVYGYLASYPKNKPVKDSTIERKLGFTHSKLTRAKKELKDKRLLLIEQIGARSYEWYLGNPNVSAAETKEIIGSKKGKI